MPHLLSQIECCWLVWRAHPRKQRYPSHRRRSHPYLHCYDQKGLSSISLNLTRKKFLPTCQLQKSSTSLYTDGLDPSQSSLLLQDWESDKLAVANLLETNFRVHAPFLAYLSACGTGRIQYDTVDDEGLHLIGACQLAGFQHVIGTLWEVNDESCFEVSKTAYEHILSEQMTDDSVCSGLHKAAAAFCRRSDESTRPSRARRVSKEANSSSEHLAIKDTPHVAEIDSNDLEALRDVKLCDSSDEESEGSRYDRFNWVPYVHYGV